MKLVYGAIIGAAITAGIAYAMWRMDESDDDKALRLAREESAKATKDLNDAHTELDAAKASLLLAKASEDKAKAEAAKVRLELAEAKVASKAEAKEQSKRAEAAIIPLLTVDMRTQNQRTAAYLRDSDRRDRAAEYDIFGNRIN